MSNEERKVIEKYVMEVFHYEHDMSTTILARLLLLCELLIDKGILTEQEIIDKMSLENIAVMMKDLNYGEDEWNEDNIKV